MIDAPISDHASASTGGEAPRHKFRQGGEPWGLILRSATHDALIPRPDRAASRGPTRNRERGGARPLDSVWSPFGRSSGWRVGPPVFAALLRSGDPGDLPGVRGGERPRLAPLNPELAERRADQPSCVRIRLRSGW